MRQAQKSLRRTQVSRTVSVPAPIGGLNARDSLADMPADDAVVLQNLFPATTECMLRYGYSNYATGLPGQVETLMDYESGTASQFFAISSGSIYNVSAAGAVGAAVVSGLTNSRWQYANFGTAGGSFLYAANGVDKPRLYDGATWTAIDGVSVPAITAVTTTTLNSPIVFKSRLFFLQVNTLKTWYLPTLSVGGAAAAIDISAFVQLGGYVVAHATWTIDAGVGVDDYYVIVTSMGEVVVYQGTDPSSATTWAIKGVYRLGTPIGSRCLIKYAGDVLYLCQDGIVPLAGALQSSRVNPRVAITEKIQFAISEAVSLYGATFGWQMIVFPKENQLWLNVPLAVGTQYQYAMNTINRSWCQYTGWAANCFELYKDNPYFGGNTVVCKAWDTNADNGNNISAYGIQAFSHFGLPGNTKEFTMMRPVLRVSGAPSINGSINVDFDLTQSTSPLSITNNPSFVWDIGQWDVGVWGGGLTISQRLQGANGVGYFGAPQLNMATKNIDVRWVSTDIVFKAGGIM